MHRIFLMLLLFSASVQAAVTSKEIEYLDEETQLQGIIYWDSAVKEKRPGVLVYHEWWGQNEYARKRAKMLAELGYVAFAADMYGKGKETTKADRAREWMQEITADPDRWRQRASAAFEQLRALPQVDPTRISAVGYCFGGGTALQMAYAGEDLKGIVSFHGSLPAAPEESKGNIRPQMLILHGQADSFVTSEVVLNFQNKLDAVGAKWEMVSYGGARHGFTNPNAAEFGIENLRYDPVADHRSWQRMQEFLKEVFQK